LYAFGDDVEYRSLTIDHPRATSLVVATFIALKYELLGVKVNIHAQDDTIKVNIPHTEKGMHLDKLNAVRLRAKCDLAAVRLADENSLCRSCGKDHNLEDIIELLMDPIPAPFDQAMANLLHVKPSLGVPTYQTPGMLSHLVLN
jgi:hypothetical protein